MVGHVMALSLSRNLVRLTSCAANDGHIQVGAIAISTGRLYRAHYPFAQSKEPVMTIHSRTRYSLLGNTSTLVDDNGKRRGDPRVQAMNAPISEAQSL